MLSLHLRLDLPRGIGRFVTTDRLGIISYPSEHCLQTQAQLSLYSP